MKVISVWDRVVKYVSDPATQEDALKIMSQRDGLTPEEFKPLLKGTRLLTLTENKKVFEKGPGLDSMYGSSTPICSTSPALIETTRTASGYRLYPLANTTPPKPGLVFDGTGPGAIEVEIWEMDQDAFGSFVAAIPAPLGIGTVTLADGRGVKGFLCEAYAAQGAEDITAFGGWRAWLDRSSGPQRESRTA